MDQTPLILELIRSVQFSLASDWQAVEYIDGCNVVSLQRVIDGREFCINSTIHSEEPRVHGCHVTTLILTKAHTFHIRQPGDAHNSMFYAAVGSIVCFGPMDIYTIGKSKYPMLSLSVHSQKSENQFIQTKPVSDDHRQLIFDNTTRALYNSTVWSFLYSE